MAALIEDLLVAARIDIGKVDVQAAQVDLREELNDVAQTLQIPAKAKYPPKGQALAWADPARVRQIIRNLLTNAERYGGPQIVATVHSGDEQAELTIRDDGPGIAADRQELIFKPYESGDERTSVTQSVGVGLTVSRQLARLMGGDLTYTFDGEWSTFTLTLPASQS